MSYARACLALFVLLGCQQPAGGERREPAEENTVDRARALEAPRFPGELATAGCGFLPRAFVAETLGVPADALETLEQPPLVACSYVWRDDAGRETRVASVLSADVHPDVDKAREVFRALASDTTVYRVNVEELRPVRRAGDPEEPPGEKLVFRTESIADLADEAAVARDQPGADRVLHVRASNLTATLTADVEVEGGPSESYQAWRQRTTTLARGMLRGLAAKFPQPAPS